MVNILAVAICTYNLHKVISRIFSFNIILIKKTLSIKKCSHAGNGHHIIINYWNIFSIYCFN